jgi:hypothetical protein
MKEEEIDYKKLVHDLNWVSNPHRPVPPEVVKVSPKILFISNSLFVFFKNHVFFVPPIFFQFFHLFMVSIHKWLIRK